MKNRTVAIVFGVLLAIAVGTSYVLEKKAEPEWYEFTQSSEARKQIKECEKQNKRVTVTFRLGTYYISCTNKEYKHP